MKRPDPVIVLLLLCGSLSASPAWAADSSAPTPASTVTATAVAPPSAPVKLGAAELEKLVGPIALYPDSVLAVMLPAAAYPLDIVQAARLMQNPKNAAELDKQPWDANVKAVARMPSVIEKMNKDLSWTIDLGQAFVNQQMEVMEAIQRLRTKAHSSGSLKTTTQQVVIVTNAVVERVVQTQVVYVTNTVIQVEPVNPQVIYLPVYDPVVVYAPPPPSYNPLVPLVTFGAGIAVGAIIANNHCDWHYGGVYVGGGGVVVWHGTGPYHPPYYPPPPGCHPPPYAPPPGYHPPPPGTRPPGYPPPAPPPAPMAGAPRPTTPATPGGAPPSTMQRWQPDPNRMQQGGAPASTAGSPSRGWSSSPTTTATHPATGTSPAGSRPPTSTGTAGARPTTGTAPSAARPTEPTSTFSRPASAPTASERPATSFGERESASAFSGMGSGSTTRSYSDRGSVSRSGGSFGGGRGGRR